MFFLIPKVGAAVALDDVLLTPAEFPVEELTLEELEEPEELLDDTWLKVLDFVDETLDEVVGLEVVTELEIDDFDVDTVLVDDLGLEIEEEEFITDEVDVFDVVAPVELLVVDVEVFEVELEVELFDVDVEVWLVEVLVETLLLELLVDDLLLEVVDEGVVDVDDTVPEPVDIEPVNDVPPL